MDNSYTGFPRRTHHLLIEGAAARPIEPLLSAEELLDAIRGEVRHGHPLARWVRQLADLHRDVERECGVPERRVIRASLVYEIDLWVERNVPQHRRGGTVHTETLGSVVDRIVAAQVRADHVLGESDASAPEVHAAWYCLAELINGYNDLVTAVVTGHRRLPVPGSSHRT